MGIFAYLEGPKWPEPDIDVFCPWLADWHYPVLNFGANLI
jgi:hypothetical protein